VPGRHLPEEGRIVWVGRDVRLGSARTCRIALGVLALLSFAAMIPLTPLAHQVVTG